MSENALTGKILSTQREENAVAAAGRLGPTAAATTGV